jgi:hypothetical protein
MVTVLAGLAGPDPPPLNATTVTVYVAPRDRPLTVPLESEVLPELATSDEPARTSTRYQ